MLCKTKICKFFINNQCKYKNEENCNFLHDNNYIFNNIIKNCETYLGKEKINYLEKTHSYVPWMDEYNKIKYYKILFHHCIKKKFNIKDVILLPKKTIKKNTEKITITIESYNKSIILNEQGIAIHDGYEIY